MQKYKTLSDINSLMSRIGCFNKAQMDNQLHETYLNESMEDEAYKMGHHHGMNRERRKDADENTKIEITNNYSILYNASRENSIKSLLEKGTNMEFVGTSAGTAAWGKGIYTNFQQYQAHWRTVNDKSLYGGILVKFKYHGNLLDECLVAEPQLWKEPLSRQVKKFKGLEEFLNKKGVSLSNADSAAYSDGMSARGLDGIRSACGGGNNMAQTLLGFGVQGVVFFGVNDRPVAVIYDADKLEIIDYAINSKITDLDKPIKWEGLKDGEGGRTAQNDIQPILLYFKDFVGNRAYTRPQCGQILLTDKKTNKQTFVDYEKAKAIIASHGQDDPRLFGDFEFNKAQNFMNVSGKELAFVQIDKDEKSQFYINKEGYLFKEPNGKPISHIDEYYPNSNEPSNNEPDNDMDFDIDDEEGFNNFKSMFGESILRLINERMNRNIINEEIVRPLVNNMMSILSIIDRTWKSPDDLYYIKIDQRFKDFRNFNTDKGFRSINDRGAKRWKREDPSGKDSTGRENHVGYCIVRGRTKDECKESVLNATVHLNPWAAKIYGKETVSSNGGMEAIIEICHKFFARAYMVLNPRSMQRTIDRAREDKKIGRFRGREFVHRAGQSKSGFDGNVDWDDIYPDALIDCDISDPQAWKDMENLLKSNGCHIYNMEKSHQGIHFVVNYKECKNLDFRPIMNKYPSFNKPGDPAILLKHDANFMAYSPAGVR